MSVYLLFDEGKRIIQKTGKIRLSRQTVIRNDLGLHVRSAAEIAKIAQQASSNIWIFNGPKKADASSILDLLTLSCSKGTVVTITADNPSDCPILDQIIACIEAGFGEC